MTVVFVHGNPEVAAIWDPLLSALRRNDAITLSPPGFGAPIPDGFGATAPEYVDWLCRELEELDGPVDLIGHDWGGGHAVGAAAARPDLVRRVATDIAGCHSPDYTWHDLAQLWRTPTEGEAFLESMDTMPLDDRVAGFESLGMTRAGAIACAEAGGPERSQCVLSLYRSADEPYMAATGQSLAASDNRPEMHVILATDDHYSGGRELTLQTAATWDARVHVLEGLGHWWMLQDPVRGAAMMTDILT